MTAPRQDLSRRLERPLVSTALLALLRRGDHATAQRVLDEANERERLLRAAPRECQGT